MATLTKKPFSWKNKRVLVTGNKGFKGSWLTLQLYSLGAKVYGIDKNKNISSLLASKLKNYNYQFNVDILNLDKTFQIIRDIKPQIVIHLAAQPLVLTGLKKPIETFKSNIIGLVNVLESIKATRSVKSVINVTSDKVYSNKNTKISFKENFDLDAIDPYSGSKVCSEIISKVYRKSYFENLNIDLYTARAGNVIGGGDISENRIFPDIFRSIRDKKKLIIRNPNHTRPWQHVLDCNNGYLKLIENTFYKPLNNKSWNFGPNQSDIMNVRNLIREANYCLPKNKKIKTEILKNENILKKTYLSLNASLAKKHLKWKQKYSLKESVNSTMNWYVNYLKNNNKIIDLSLREIENYYKKQ